MDERKNRARRKGFAFTITDFCYIDADGFPPYRQIARSLGLDWDYNHPNIEAMINFDPSLGQHTVMTHVLNTIAAGARYAPGDRIRYKWDRWNDEYIIEFRESCDAYGPCLRAVVLGIEEEFQSLDSDAACAYISRHATRRDPFEEY